MFFNPKVFTAFLLYWVWVLGLHWASWRLNLWNFRLIGESAFWAGGAGCVFLMSSVTKSGIEEDFFRKRSVEAVKFGALFEFFLNTEPLGLIGELVLQPVVALLMLIRVQTATFRDESQVTVRRCVDGLLSLAGFALIAYTSAALVRDWPHIDMGQELRNLAMPIWLTFGSVPFLAVLALVAAYGSLFSVMKTSTGLSRTSLRSRIGVMLALHFRIMEIRSVRGRHAQQAGRAGTVRDGMATIRDLRAARADAAAEKEARVNRLKAYSGVDGVDETDRRLDQREFEETKKALRMIATCQMGRYNNNKKYRDDLLTILDFRREGLPEDHGVALKVRKGGQEWYAYRRTITGWVLGIGANKGTPDQWFYDGPEPPRSYPRPGHGWGDVAHVDTTNWR